LYESRVGIYATLTLEKEKVSFLSKIFFNGNRITRKRYEILRPLFKWWENNYKPGLMPMISRKAIINFALNSNPRTSYSQTIMDLTTNVSFFDTNRWGNTPKILESLKLYEWLGAKKFPQPADQKLGSRWLQSKDMQQGLYDIR
jgi:hypothetical protein